MHPEQILQGVPNPERAAKSRIFHLLIVFERHAQFISYFLLGPPLAFPRFLQVFSHNRPPFSPFLCQMCYNVIGRTAQEGGFSLKKATVEQLALIIANKKINMELDADKITLQFIRILDDVKKAVEDSGVALED